MGRKYQKYTRAPYKPFQCVACLTHASEDNPLIDIEKQIDFYGMVYICYRCIVNIGDQFGFATPAEASRLREENTALTAKIQRIPAVTERLINDIRDISLSSIADLLSDSPAIVHVDDTSVEPLDSGVSESEHGDDSTPSASSEPAVDEGPVSVPASAGSKRTTKAAPRTSTPSNR